MAVTVKSKPLTRQPVCGYPILVGTPCQHPVRYPNERCPQHVAAYLRQHGDLVWAADKNRVPAKVHTRHRSHRVRRVWRRAITPSVQHVIVAVALTAATIAAGYVSFIPAPVVTLLSGLAAVTLTPLVIYNGSKS